MSKYTKGQIICLKSDDNRKGMISDIVTDENETLYKVFIDGSIKSFYESQLISEKQNSHIVKVNKNLFNAHITALQIRNPALSSLYSLNSARIDFIPYQFRPVLKFIKADQPRLLIADSVGVGKTIEAGLILQELKARKNIDSVLIICPRPLVAEKKWEDEMKRFGEDFTALDGKTLKYCIQETDYDGEWPDKFKKIIIPYSLFNENTVGENKKKGLLKLNPVPHFDLVIVDEAHHIRNRNWRYEAVKYFCDNADAVVFLTATPIQLGDDNLFNLLNVLRPDLIIDKASFDYIAEPNQYINKAVLTIRKNSENWQNIANEMLLKAVDTDYGKSFFILNNNFSKICEKLQNGKFTDGERIEIINQIENLNTFSNLINRTRRRDIGNFTIRDPHTVEVPFSEDQKFLYNEILRIKKELYQQKHGLPPNEKFILSMISRQIASCTFGLVPSLKAILQRKYNELEPGELDYNFDEENQLEFSISLEEQIKQIIDFAENIKITEDTKLIALKKILAEKQKHTKNKVMIFSTFRHSLNYLYNNLKQDFRVGLMHGGTKDEERRELRKRFMGNKENDNCIDIMLFSEIGCEGLDYQFCDTMVNYDLPWNPMKIEQRIGRIDRNGQDSDKVMIYNLITPETIDADIYERCLKRIGVFEQVIGDCEEILGKVAKEIENIAENFELSETQRKEKLQQLADNEIRKIQEQEKLEKEQMEFFGISLPKDKMKKEIDDASNFWLSSKLIYNTVKLYLQNKTQKEQVELTATENPLKKFDISQETKELLFKDFGNLQKQKNPIWREWEKWLKGTVWNTEKEARYIPVTFEQETAKENENILLVNLNHPLAKQAANYFKQSEKIMVNLSVRTGDIPVGNYEFAIYSWVFKGIKNDLILKVVSLNDNVSSKILDLLEIATENPNDISVETNFAKFERQHYKIWRAAKNKHIQETEEIMKRRKESLQRSFEYQNVWLDKQIQNSSDEKVVRMRKSQKENAKSDFERKVSELETLGKSADVIFEEIGYGVLEVKNEVGK
jgi:superfamily II DNA or RNA helicase